MRTRQGTIPLGIREEFGLTGDHVAYFWETPAQFEEGVGFLEAGLRGRDHCVIFGHDSANDEVVGHLRSHGFDVEALRSSGRLTVLGGSSTSAEMLANIGSDFQAAVDRGAPLIRLLGNIGWGHAGWPEEEDILAFEARVTTAARAFPCIVVCMYDVQRLSGRVMVHGAFETHPVTVIGNVLRENPFYVGMDEFLARLAEKGAKDELG